MKNELEKAVKMLARGKVILYPTDTIWGIGCDATQPKSVEKIYKIKQRAESKSMIVLLDDAGKLTRYVKKVPDIAYDLIERYQEPLTIIYPDAMNVARNVIAQDGTLAIRIVRDDFCREMIRMLDRPLVSSSANLSGEQAPIVFSQISDGIKKQVDYIVNYNREVMIRSKASTLIRLLENSGFEVLRK